jgi:hypothetical protein
MGKIRNGESIDVDIGFGGFRGLCGPHYDWPLSRAISLSGGRMEPSFDVAGRWPLRRHRHIFWWWSGWRASTQVIGDRAQTTALREDRGVGCRSCLWGATRKGNAIGPCRTPTYQTPEFVPSISFSRQAGGVPSCIGYLVLESVTSCASCSRPSRLS